MRSVCWRQAAAPFNINAGVSRSVNDQGRNTDAGKDTGDIDLAVQTHKRHGGGGSRAEPLVSSPPFLECRISDHRGSEHGQARAAAPTRIDIVQQSLQGLFASDPRGKVRERTIEHERFAAVRLRGGEIGGERAAFGGPDDGRPFDAHSIQDGTQVIYARIPIADLVRNGSVPIDWHGRLRHPDLHGHDKIFPTLKDLEKARDVITNGWGEIVGVGFVACPPKGTMARYPDGANESSDQAFAISGTRQGRKPVTDHWIFYSSSAATPYSCQKPNPPGSARSSCPDFGATDHVFVACDPEQHILVSHRNRAQIARDKDVRAVWPHRDCW
ncbi:hypothetical protein MPLSOD_160139 [Mesorhizobium sp. SOD10]|nr:hypothetical protein MPLSOD_160139 [Mesorhizobium sp. SOD10]